MSLCGNLYKCPSSRQLTKIFVATHLNVVAPVREIADSSFHTRTCVARVVIKLSRIPGDDIALYNKTSNGDTTLIVHVALDNISPKTRITVSVIPYPNWICFNYKLACPLLFWTNRIPAQRCTYLRCRHHGHLLDNRVSGQARSKIIKEQYDVCWTAPGL